MTQFDYSHEDAQSSFNNTSFNETHSYEDAINIIKTIYKHLNNVPFLIPIISLLNGNILNVKNITSFILLLFNYKKIKFCLKIYLIIHICMLFVYLYNRSIVKFINIDIPKLYLYMDKHGKVNDTFVSLYKAIILNNLSFNDRRKVEGFVNTYLINGFNLIIIPLKNNLLKTLQDVENLIHGYVKV
ncbi:hypothetical protein QEN19_002123 [Hanseniaspora menglaensis]